MIIKVYILFFRLRPYKKKDASHFQIIEVPFLSIFNKRDTLLFFYWDIHAYPYVEVTNSGFLFKNKQNMSSCILKIKTFIIFRKHDRKH